MKRDKSCKGCVYCSSIAGDSYYLICNYFLMTDKRRPCPPGRDCTVRETVCKDGKKDAI